MLEKAGTCMLTQGLHKLILKLSAKTLRCAFNRLEANPIPYALNRLLHIIQKSHTFNVNSVFMNWRFHVLEGDVQNAAVKEGLNSLAIILKRRYRQTFWTMHSRTVAKQRKGEAAKRFRLVMQRTLNGLFNLWKNKAE